MGIVVYVDEHMARTHPSPEMFGSIRSQFQEMLKAGVLHLTMMQKFHWPSFLLRLLARGFQWSSLAVSRASCVGVKLLQRHWWCRQRQLPTPELRK